MKKKLIVSIVLIINLIFLSNVVKAWNNFTDLDGFKNWADGIYGISDKNVEYYDEKVYSLKVYLNGAEKNERGVYEIRVNNADGSSEIVGVLTEADLKSAKIWVADGCPYSDKNDNYDPTSEEAIKLEIYNGFTDYIGMLYKSSMKDGKIDYNEYLRKLNEKIETVKIDNQYTGDLQEYRISLYQKEIDKTEALINVNTKFEKDIEGMTEEDIKNELERLKNRLETLEHMPDGWVEYDKDTDTYKDRDTLIAETKAMIDLYEQKQASTLINGSTVIYTYPEQDNAGRNSASSLDDMIGDADKFISSANGTVINNDSLQSFSKTYYNIFLTIGIIVATLVGAVLGIKFMIGGAEEKADVKEKLVAYVVGCIVVFGSFAIWKLVVTILGSVK